MAWHVLHVAPRPVLDEDDRLTHDNIFRRAKSLGVEMLQFTELRHRPRKKPVRVATFPGYLFARFDVGDARWSQLLHVDGVISILGDGVGKPTPLTDDEFDTLRERLLRRDDEVETERVWFRPGCELKVVAGPIEGQIVTFVAAKGKDEVRVIAGMFGRKAMIVVARRDVVLIN
jgi:transcription antitermination factor NusG